jgi:NADPH:quinone reductase
MRAIVIKEFGGPEVLAIEDRPMPALQPGFVLIEVKAFGLNRAEIYMRKGAWGKTAEISGIECVGVVSRDPSGHWSKGEKVMALVGGMGRDVNGTYAEFVAVPAANVVAITSELGWDELAAIPESYATAWSASLAFWL